MFSPLLRRLVVYLCLPLALLASTDSAHTNNRLPDCEAPAIHFVDYPTGIFELDDEVLFSWMVVDSHPVDVSLQILQNGSIVDFRAGLSAQDRLLLDPTELGVGAYECQLLASDSYGNTSTLTGPTFWFATTTDAQEQPQSMLLLQAYPNPFNPSTTLHIELPETALVKLSLYDITGKKQMDLAEALMASGQHLITLNAAALPSGVYFLHLIAGLEQKTERLLLLK
jgi:hypothetical protein